MLINMLKSYCFLMLFFLLIPKGEAYDVAGVNATSNFGTIAPPFADLTLTNNTICVAYTILVEPSTYRVRATSSTSSSTAFQLANTSDSSYKLNYSVSWAGTAGSSPSFVSLSSGQDSSSTFTAQLLGLNTCLILPPNATMRLQLLGANQVLAKQGNYTDTLTILIVSS